MAKLNKEQIAEYDRLYNSTIGWGDESDVGRCTGMFEIFGDNLQYLATGVDESRDTLYVYHASSPYDYRLFAELQINRRGKSVLRKIVTFLIDNDFGDDFSLAKIR